MRGEPTVFVRRGALVESVHEAAACAVAADGSTVLARGDIESVIYLRSASKPFIAATVVAAGAVERFGLSEYEIAVMAASHNGEPYHIAAVRSILAKIGLDESALQCGAHAPYDEVSAAALRAAGESFGRIHNNCSGKHAGILALCVILGSDPSTYMDRSNPAQQRILSVCAGLSDERADTMPIAVDGCGIPVYATTVRNAALAYMRLATLEGVSPALARAMSIVRDAMIAFPQYVSGTGEFDAALMSAGNGQIACKGGAEGVHGSALIALGTGLVIKIIDGNERARPPAAISMLEHLHALAPGMRLALEPFARPILRNRAGTVVGGIEA